MTYSIVIPVFRATASLEVIYLKSKELLGKQFSKLILVFDQGKVDSWNKIEELANRYPDIIGIQLNRNFGQHNATICGFQYVDSEYLITMDEDLEHHPTDILKLIIKQKEENADIVYAHLLNRSHNSFRNITSKILNTLLKLGMPELHPHYSGFRLIRTDVAKGVLEMRSSYTFLDGYLTWVTTNVVSVDVEHGRSQSGRSSYKLKDLIRHFINIFVTFSSLPIRLLTSLSFLLFALSSTYAVVIIFNTLMYDTYAAGFPTLITMLGFGFGAILLGLGIIGEYIQRINLKTTHRPVFIVKNTLNSPKR
ncbi:glycosyl transferase [Belliella baltica DSM 15883]|uniref:Glycosyl transferase n=2 Tax=Belliella TaxID=232244 RepID=I3Z744_BELBD|nr:glycosyl transferase [Belliella baltica DSM 15883]